MSGISKWLRLRASEWIAVCFFAYVAAISPFFADRPNLGLQPFVVWVGVCALLFSLARLRATSFTTASCILSDWLPIFLTLLAFREMELFLPKRFDHHFEGVWILQDDVFLRTWKAKHIIESLGNAIPIYLELSYLFVYGLGAYCIGLLYAVNARQSTDRFLAIYLVGTLGAYALFPYFPSQPPRILYPGLDEPSFSTWVRDLNLYILNKATIHVGVFPSAHVSSAFSSAWGMFSVIPQKRIVCWGMVWYAISVSLATVYGRYHYSADVIAGFAVSLAAAALAIWKRSTVSNAIDASR